MAENAKIAALRAASSEAPQGPSGPQALAYPWMTDSGRELVIPTRAPIDQQAWRNARDAQSKRPPPPTSPAGGFKLPPGFRGKSVIPVNPASTVRDIRPQVGGEPEFYADMYVPQKPVYTPDESQSEVPSEPTYFDPGQYSYVPETFVAPLSSPAEESKVVLPQFTTNEVQFEPTYFDLGQYSYVPEPTASTPAASPAPTPMPAQTFAYEPPSAPAVAQVQTPDQTPDLMMYNSALLELLQQQEDPLVQMKMAYEDPNARFFDL